MSRFAQASTCNAPKGGELRYQSMLQSRRRQIIFALAAISVLVLAFSPYQLLPKSGLISLVLALAGGLAVFVGAFRLGGPLKPLVAGLVLGVAADVLGSSKLIEAPAVPATLIVVLTLGLNVAAVACLGVAVIIWFRKALT